MVKIIINPYSAKGLKVWKDIKERIEDSGIKYDFVIAGQKRAAYLAKKAQEEGIREIFIVGGDGTINEVINALDFKDVVLGIIPAGCGNDFAKMIGVKSVEDGLASMLGGYKKSVDVGFANDRYFLNNLGIGVDARVVDIHNRLKKIRSRPGYLVPVLLAFFEFTPFFVIIESGDFRFSGQVLGVTVGNGRFHGGLFSLTPEARIDDGFLDICVIKKIDRLKRVLNIGKAIKGTHIFLKETEIFRTASFSIFSESPFSVHFDGELAGRPMNKLKVKVLNKQLQFSLPAEEK